MVLAVGVAELVTGILQGQSLVISVGDYVIDHAPGSASRAAIEVLGKNDKPVLVGVIVGTVLVLGALAGALTRRRFAAGAAVFAAVGLVGALAGAYAPLSSAGDSLVTGAAAAAAGTGALFLLTRRDTAESESIPGPGRRRFFRLSGATVGLAAASFASGRWLFGPAVDIEEERASVELPRGRTPAAPSPTSTAAAATTTPAVADGPLAVVGLPPLITPNEEFYRIDAALGIPGVDIESWRLKVTGLVDRPLELSYEDLLAGGVSDETVTLSCVSNEIGGSLVGNAVWTGVSLASILERAGIQPQGSQIIARSVDRFTTAFPTAVALDGRPSMVAVGMNGEVLPAAHGFPARMIVPGLYGYVSATKWLGEIEVATDEFDAYWITRGWAKEGPMKTSSRIDVPGPGAKVTPGRVQFGGIAWAGIRGIRRVEVRIVFDQDAIAELGNNWTHNLDAEYGEWREATLEPAPSGASWRRWALDWEATQPGNYLVEARATDGPGAVQTNRRQEPFPDGATGYPGLFVWVRDE